VNKCDVCQKETVELILIADRDGMNAPGFLLVCGGCADLHQEEHFEDIFRSPVDFDLVNADRRLLRLCQVA
jgi:hypothetical protein